jgi:hypothetical protein
MSDVTLSKLEDYNVDQLTADAAFWRNSQTLWAENHLSNVSSVAALDWEGLAGEAANMRTLADMGTADAAAEVSQAASSVADGAGAALMTLRSTALLAVDAARADGFTVGNDFTVSDPNPVPAGLAAARRTQAQAHSAAIVSAVEALVEFDRDVARLLDGHTAALQAVRFGGGNPPSSIAI